MEYKLKDEDHLNLWRYFEDKATSVKGAMFNTITWIIGFAAALLGFLFANLANFDSCKAAISLSTLMKLIAVAGLVICFYALFAIGESAKHIRNNWEYAKRCHEEIQGLNDIVPLNNVENNRKAENKRNNTMKIWNRLRIIVLIFLAAFIIIFVWSFLM